MTRVFGHIHSRVSDFPTVTFHLGNDDLGKHLSFLVLKKLSKASIKTKLKYFKCYYEMWKLCLRVLIPATERLIKPLPYQIST